MIQNVYLFTISATVCFAISSIFFTEYAHKTSAIWVNAFKATIATIFCFLTIQFFSGWHMVTPYSIFMFALSGYLGLNIGDYYMVNAFKLIGPGRTLLLYGFQPLIVGTASYFIFDQKIDALRFIAIIFFIGCLVTFSYERFKASGKWEINGLLMALAFVVLDSIGLIITRLAFDDSPSIDSVEGHFYRSSGAFLGFFIHSFFKPFHFFEILKKLTPKGRFYIGLGAFIGTFLSLILYFKAVQTGHLATITSIAITTPFFVTIAECIYYKKWPSKFMLLASIQFILGFYFLVWA